MVELSDRPIGALSGGQRKRAFLARAIAQRASVLLLDEPFSALDEVTRRRLEDDLLEIWEKEKFTVLFVTHLVSEAIYLSQRIIVLSSGPAKVIHESQINYQGSKKDFKESKEFQEINNNIYEKLEKGIRE